MGYCLKIIKKDGDVVKHYFSSYDELDYNATLCQFSTNIIKAIGMKIGLFKNKILFEIGQFGIVFAITLNRKSSKTIKIMNRKKILEVAKGLNYLVSDDKDSSSSKMVKAKSLGITLISSEEFLKMI